jgi:hypothetical protein
MAHFQPFVDCVMELHTRESKEFLGHLNDGVLFKEDSVPCNGSERKRNHGIFAQFQTNQILLNSSLLIVECNILD